MARLILHARYFAPNAKKRQGRLSLSDQILRHPRGCGEAAEKIFFAQNAVFMV